MGAFFVSSFPELRTIFYDFRPHGAPKIGALQTGSSPNTDPATRPGLTRRELDYETPYEVTVETNMSSGIGPSGIGPSGIDPSGIDNNLLSENETVSDTVGGGSLDLNVEDNAVTWAPEVVGLGFRYFGGNNWTTQWDSLQRKSLPVAVEVTMHVRPFEPERSEGPLTVVPEPVALLPGDDENILEQPALANSVKNGPAEITDTYRLVINVPGASRHGGVSQPLRNTMSRAGLPSMQVPAMQVPRLSAPAPLRVKPLNAVPSLNTGRPRRQTPRSDQWIRAQRP